VSCHNTSGVNDRTARFEGGSAVAEPLDFRIMIHKIHRGDLLTRPYAIGGTAGTLANPAGAPNFFFDGVEGTRYPQTTGNCEACHASKNWTLPMKSSPAYAPSTSVLMTCSEPAGSDGNAFCDDPFWTASVTTKIPPQSSVCTSCHDSPDVAAHAATNTTPSGTEACATCHGPGAIEDVALFHGLP
jgi:OmcA/MtrC family decaheme c-type cytochrome